MLIIDLMNVFYKFYNAYKKFHTSQSTFQSPMYITDYQYIIFYGRSAMKKQYLAF